MVTLIWSLTTILKVKPIFCIFVKGMKVLNHIFIFNQWLASGGNRTIPPKPCLYRRPGLSFGLIRLVSSHFWLLVFNNYGVYFQITNEVSLLKTYFGLEIFKVKVKWVWPWNDFQNHGQGPHQGRHQILFKIPFNIYIFTISVTFLLFFSSYYIIL